MTSGAGKGWTIALVALLAASLGIVATRFGRSLKSDEPFRPFAKIAGGAATSAPLGGRVAPFELVDQDGRAFTQVQLADKVWIADFIFTSCAGPCPAMTSAMQRLRGALPGDGVAFVSFSVDPERDTPQALEAYARRYGGPDPRWRLLTGDRATIARVARGSFLLGVEAGDGHAPPDALAHSTRFVLVDRGLRVHGTFRFEEAAPDGGLAPLVESARSLLAGPTR